MVQSPILTCADTIAEELKAVGSVNPMFMTTAEKAAALERLAQVRAQLEELWLRVVAASGDVAEAAGDRDLSPWLRVRAHMDLKTARGEVEFANALDARYSDLAAAMREGLVSSEQARAITHALDDLPADMGSEGRLEAEALLVKESGQHTPSELRRLGRAIAEVVDPERFEDSEAKALEREEQAAQEKVSAHFRDHGDGTWTLHGRLPTGDAVRLRTFLEAFAQPRRQALAESGKRIRYHRLMGQALQQLIGRIGPDRLPHHGGDATTVMVTIALKDLLSDLGTAHLDTGETISAGQARRLACNADLIPIVLGSHGQVLDVGRTSRLYTPVQRKAIRYRDKTCRAEGCTTPGTWCDVHHLTPWSQGGRTDLNSGVLLCGHHHRRAHRPHITTERLSTGRIRFHTRT